MIDFLLSPWTTPHMMLTPVQEVVLLMELFAAFVIGWAIWNLCTRKR